MCRNCTALGKAITALRGDRPVPLPAHALQPVSLHFDYPFPGGDLDDPVASAYQADLLAAVEAENGVGCGLAAIHVKGDGNCLLHAVSRAIFGSELFYHVIRHKVAAELQEGRSWYLQHVFSFDEEMYDEALACARTDRAWAFTQHLAVVANILRRPVALLAPLTVMREQPHANGVATYLPARHQPVTCCPHPLLISWGNADMTHFVPLCRVSDTSAPALPLHCRPPHSVPPGFSEEAYVPTGCWCLNSTTAAELPANCFLRAREQKTPFLHKLVDMAATAAATALNALTPAAAVAALTKDFVKRAAECKLLAVAACTQHAAFIEAEQLLSARPPALDGLDVFSVAAYARLQAAVSPPCAAALRVCVIDQVQEQLLDTFNLLVVAGLSQENYQCKVHQLTGHNILLSSERNMLCVQLEAAAAPVAAAPKRKADEAQLPGAPATAAPADRFAALEATMAQRRRWPRWAPHAKPPTEQFAQPAGALSASAVRLGPELVRPVEPLPATQSAQAGYKRVLQPGDAAMEDLATRVRRSPVLKKFAAAEVTAGKPNALAPGGSNADAVALYIRFIKQQKMPRDMPAGSDTVPPGPVTEPEPTCELYAEDSLQAALIMSLLD